MGAATLFGVTKRVFLGNMPEHVRELYEKDDEYQPTDPVIAFDQDGPSAEDNVNPVSSERRQAEDLNPPSTVRLSSFRWSFY